jgi:hypothetical protein
MSTYYRTNGIIKWCIMRRFSVVKNIFARCMHIGCDGMVHDDRASLRVWLCLAPTLNLQRHLPALVHTSSASSNSFVSALYDSHRLHTSIHLSATFRCFRI